VKTALVAALALILAAPAWASEQRPTQSEVETEVMCPECATTLDQSDSPIARRMKAFVARRIAAGDTKSEIKAQLVAGVVVGALVAAALAWCWSRDRDAAVIDDVAVTNARGTVDPELERRVDAELAKLD
jgi:hypothetical protein